MSRMRNALIAMLCGALAGGCGDGSAGPGDPREGEADKKVRAKWGKSLADLPTVELVLISPHNENICNEFEWAFSLHHAVEHGQKVDIIWRDVAGGSTSILHFLENTYKKGKGGELDIVWGGGEDNFQKMAADGILQKMAIPADVLANVPESFGGLSMYDPNHYWLGSAVSGFGFLYNKPLLDKAGVSPPKQWGDLGRAEFHDRVCLANPTLSGSAAAAYEMIVQSGATWPEGWAKLLSILGNAKKFVDSASKAAGAPGLGEAPVAACIDFYGTNWVRKAPDALVYVSPKGETAFNADPIAILRDPPHAEVAQRFVDFALSRRGQALWALKVGEPDGPIRTPLGRQPIRRDVYEAYAGRFSAGIVNPFERGEAMKLDQAMWRRRFGVLRKLVGAAAMDNREFLRAAKKKLIDTSFDPQRLAEFNRLPENIDTADEIAEVSAKLRDATEAERITTDWQRFFREKYKRVAE
ncbi:MAG TPA: extracellular solute-binding protein [Phycisphaerae bacterium]|nr:extracellular solute-binding protein [Phycisphaerae bacterium]